MSGTRTGGQHARLTLIRRYGEDYYRQIGQKGGSAPYSAPKGFAARPERASSAGRIGGSRSKRGKADPATLKTHCKRGHAYDKQNTYLAPETGLRTCKACRALRARAQRQTTQGATA